MVNLRWRFQQKSDNGQELTFTSNINPDIFCKGCSGNQRSSHLRQTRSIQPNYCFVTTRQKKTKVYISHDIHIKTLVQEAVSHVYSLKDKDALSNLTAHSIRVETYVTLYLLNKNTSFIQFRLRWRSDAFNATLQFLSFNIAKHVRKNLAT